EKCPEFSLKTSRLHWSTPDPAAVTGWIYYALNTAALTDLFDAITRAIGAGRNHTPGPARCCD
ncbi:MAG TPA: hypothetical protein VKB77_07700, partial [Terriglobales bacterium]|nr:hypothetical protein [Terriglobales bacterium]